MNNWLNRLERKYGRFGIPNLTNILVGGQILVLAIELFVNRTVTAWLALSRFFLLQGQVWRVVSFVFIPFSGGSILSVVLGIYFTWFVGTALEREWGDFRYTVYLLSGMLGTVLACLVTGLTASTYCLSLSLLSALGLRYRMEAIGSWVRKAYTGFLGAITFLLSALLGCQSVLSARADSLRMKGIKYAVGNLLPVAGSAVSGSLGSVAAGVDLLRSICGVCGVLLLGLLLLPVLVELLLFRAVIRLASVAATSLDCAADARLLDDVAELYGYMAGAVSLCSVFFILTLCVLIACGSALG